MQFDTLLLHPDEAASPSAPGTPLNMTQAFADSVDSVLDAALALNPWLSGTKLVVKPDQLIKRRYKDKVS